MKKQILLILALIISFNCTMAQQLPNVSYFMYDHSRTNPGSLGSKDMVCVSGIMKQSMVGFEGAPNNFFFNTEVPFKLFGAKHGLGLSFLNENIGFYQDIDIRLGYAFRFKVAEGTLGLGVGGNLRQKSLVDPEWIAGQGNDANSDPNIPQGEENLQSFGASVGLFYRSEDIYLGASVLNIYSTNTEYDPGLNNGNEITEMIRPHYYLSAGYSYQLSNPAFEIEPAINFYTDAVSSTFDINGTITYNKKLWLGVSYRTRSTIVGMAGLSILDGLKVGYAYDYNASAISRYSQGGHEFILNYCFKLGVEKSPQRYRSIRYL